MKSWSGPAGWSPTWSTRATGRCGASWPPESGERGSRRPVRPPWAPGAASFPGENLKDRRVPSPAMYPGHWAQVTPDKPAIVMAGTDDVITFKELDERSIRLARVWHNAGL